MCGVTTSPGSRFQTVQLKGIPGSWTLHRAM
jgi:hypothetical protein